MKPFTIALSINISLLLICFLLDFGVFGNYDWTPVQTTLIAVVNTLAAGFFLYDRRKHIALPFGLFALLVGAGAAALWVLYFKARMEMGAVNPEFMESVWPIKRGF